jgi:hypothetical protein
MRELRNTSGKVMGYQEGRMGKVQRDKPSKKKKGADGKACWDGYRFAGTVNGRDRCVKTGK